MLHVIYFDFLRRLKFTRVLEKFPNPQVGTLIPKDLGKVPNKREEGNAVEKSFCALTSTCGFCTLCMAHCFLFLLV